MSKTVQWKRGNTSVNNTYTGAEGEITVDTDTWDLRVHDGVTAGGWTIDSSNSGASFGNVTAGNIAVTTAITSNTVTTTGNVTANYFIGNGSQLSGIAPGYSDSNVITLLGNLGSNTISTSGNLYVNNAIVSSVETVAVRMTANVITVGTPGGIHEDTPFLIYSTGNVAYISTANRNTGNVSLKLESTYAAGGLNIRADNGRMGFNTDAWPTGSGWDFSFNGSVYGTEFTASANQPTGYQFATADGDTGLSHEEISANLSALRIRHSGVETVKFYSNNTTEMKGNIVVSDGTSYGSFPDAYMQVYGNVDSYQQIVNQNINGNNLASTDFVATANNGDDSTYFVDLGIASNTYSYPGYGIIKPNDAYLLAVGNNITGPGSVDSGNLILGTTTGNIKLFVGAPEDANIVATINSDSVTVTGNVIPSANVTYTLGNATNQWASLYVSGNTIYLDSIPLTISGNTLSINGSSVATTTDTSTANADMKTYVDNQISSIGAHYNDANVVSLLASFGSNAIATTGNISAGNIIVDVGTIYTEELIANTFNANTAIVGYLGSVGNIVADGFVQATQVITPDVIASRVTASDVDGVITILSGVTGNAYVYLNDDGANTAAALGNDLGNVVITSATGTWTFDDQNRLQVPGTIIDAQTETNFLTLNNGSGTVVLGSDGSNPVTISTNSNDWTFWGNGALSAPGNISTTGTITATREVTGQYFTIDNSGYRGDLGFSGGNLAMMANLGFQISTDYFGSGESAPVWTFDTNGDLDSPGNITTIAGNISAGNLIATTQAKVDTLSITNNRIDAVTQFAIATSNTASGDGTSILMDRNGAGLAVQLTSNSSTYSWGLYSDNILFPDGSRQYSSYSNTNVASYLPTYTGNISAGNITSSGTIVSDNGSGYQTSIDPDGITAVYSGSTIYTIVKGPGGGSIIAESGKSFAITANGAGPSGKEWLFDYTGNLTTPGNITTSSNVYANNISATHNLTVGSFLYANVLSAPSNTLTLAAGTTSIAGLLSLGYGAASSGNITAANLVANSNVVASGAVITTASVDTLLVRTADFTGNITSSTDLILKPTGKVSVPVAGGAVEIDVATGNVTLPGAVYTGDINVTGSIGLSGNITGSSSNVELGAGSYTWTFDNTGNTAFANGTVSLTTLSASGDITGLTLISTNSSGNEGGEIRLAAPAANTTVNTSVTIDSFQDKVRLFETGGTNRGLYVDLSAAPAGVSTAIGYLTVPQITLSANTTAALTDSGKHFYSTTAGDLSILIPTNANVAFPTGTAFTVVVQAAGNVLVNADSGVTLYMAGSNSSSNRVVGAYGMATVMKVATDTWFINGTGVY